MTVIDLNDPTEAAGEWRTVVRSVLPSADWLPGGVHISDRSHPTFQAARRAGLQAACWNVTTHVDVYSPDGTLECSWQAVDEQGGRDNLWRSVGPVAQAVEAADVARFLDEARRASEANVAAARARARQRP
jgi:hypothetical protein